MKKIYTGLIPLAAILTIPLIFIPAAALAIDYTFNAFDVPGSSHTWAFGINNFGDIVGSYEDGTGRHGFLYAGGNLTTIDFPLAPYTYAHGINDSGKIVGHYSDATGRDHGFAYTGGTFTTIDFPRGDNTRAYGINNLGDIVGEYHDNWGWHGFLDVGGTFPTIAFPGGGETGAYGINNSGYIVGYYDSFKYFGYLKGGIGGFINLIDATGSGATFAHAINDSGDIVGWYEDARGRHGFLYAAGRCFSSIDFPGAFRTEPYGINNSGDIVGSYYDATGPHGFIAYPASLEVKKGALSDLTKLLAQPQNEQDANKLKDAIEHLYKSLDPNLWVNGNHLDPKHGQEVFNEEKETVNRLNELLKNGLPVQGFINSLVRADKSLAQTAIDDAIAGQGNAKGIANAQKEMAAAQQDIGNGNYESAIEHYGKAWKDVQKP